MTPYGAYGLVLVDRGAGLAWHRGTLLQNAEMQTVLGSNEAVEAFGDNKQVAKKWSGRHVLGNGDSAPSVYPCGNFPLSARSARSFWGAYSEEPSGAGPGTRR